MKKRLLALIAAALLTTTFLVGCGDTEEKNSDTDAPAVGDGTGDDVDADADTGILTENGTFPIIKEGENYELSIFAALRQDVTSYEAADNSMTAAFEEKTGFTIEWQTCPMNDRVTKINTMMGANEYPDVILDHFWSPSEQVLYGEQGSIIPLNDLIDEYGPNIKAALDAFPAVKDNMTMTDGNIYSLPLIDGAPQSEANHKFYINKTWLDNVGIEKVPETLDEFTAAMIAFRDNDANGNGDATDEIPLSGTEFGWNNLTLEFLMNSFTYYTRFCKYMYIDESGKVVYARVTDEFREGVKYLNKLYEEKIINDSIFTQDLAAYQATTMAPGGTLVGASAAGYLGMMFTKDNDGWKEYVACAPFDNNGTRYAVYTPAVGMAALSITDNCEYPEAVIRAWDLFFIDENGGWMMHNFGGEEGSDWAYAEEGSLDSLGRQAIYSRIPEGSATVGSRSWKTLGPVLQPADFFVRFELPGGEHDMETKLYEETVNYYTPYLPKDMHLPNLILTTEEAALAVDAETAMNSYFTQKFTEFIKGDIDVEDNAVWQEYLDEFNNSLGLPAYLEMYQSVYDAQK